MIYCIFDFCKSLSSNFKKTKINWEKIAAMRGGRCPAPVTPLQFCSGYGVYSSFSSHFLPILWVVSLIRYSLSEPGVSCSELKQEWKSEIHIKAAGMEILSWIYSLCNYNSPFTWTFEQAGNYISNCSFSERNPLPKLFKFKLGKEFLLLRVCCLHHHNHKLLRFEIVRKVKDA